MEKKIVLPLANHLKILCHLSKEDLPMIAQLFSPTLLRFLNILSCIEFHLLNSDDGAQCSSLWSSCYTIFYLTHIFFYFFRALTIWTTTMPQHSMLLWLFNKKSMRLNFASECNVSSESILVGCRHRIWALNSYILKYPGANITFIDKSKFISSM